MSTFRSLDVTITVTDEDEKIIEEIEAYKDTRHGHDGWRALRYLPNPYDPDELDWDEQNQFYFTLGDLYAAVEIGEYQAGKDRF